MRTDRDARSGAAARPGTGPTASPRADPLVGRLVDGRYEITRRIARGGMASVYEAHDLRLDRTVAVKVMHPGMGDDEAFAARFVREARAAAKLSHPNVVNVYDQGEDDGIVFLAMELVAGGTLRDAIAAEAPMTPAKALAYVEPVLRALAAAHRAGLVHRDVKPENVLIRGGSTTSAVTGTLDLAGSIKVADFGLARAVTAETQHTSSGVLIGTVSYIAPELVIEGRADARADVYGVGVMLYELLTGQKPHAGETPIQVAYKHVHDDVPAPSRTVPGIPDYVDALVARATARDRALRPSDAGVLLHQVRRVLTALHEGLRSDDDLTADLALPVAPVRDDQDDPFAEGHEPTLVEERLPFATRAPGGSTRGREHTAVLRVDRTGASGDDGSPGVADRAAVPDDRDDRGDPHDSHDSAPARTPGVDGDAAARARSRRTRRPGRDRARGRPGAAKTPGDRPVRPRRRRWRRVLVTVLVLLVLGGGSAGGWWLLEGRYTHAPAVAGLDRAAATARLQEAGLAVEVTQAYSDTVPAGQVIASDPGPGDKVLDGGSVEVTVSKGVEEYRLPQLGGSSLAEATERLDELKMAVADPVEEWSETVPEGRVIRIDPPGGTVLRPGAMVTIHLSKGRRPIEVTSWEGRDADRAQRHLGRQGLKVTVERAFSDTVPAGRVISQSPEEGTLYRKDTVTLLVSRGPQLVEVPDVRAQGVASATDALESAGFEVEVEEYALHFGLGYVMEQEHLGDKVPKGSTITVWVS